MAWPNLFQVTETLIELLTQNITQNLDTSLAGMLNVSAVPPERVGENPQNTLSFFLYHVTEDPYYKNDPGPGNDIPNISTAPMALSLFYILTAHHETQQNQFDAETQQRLMGYALKTLHDFPVVTDQTTVNGTPILDPSLHGVGNSLQIVMRPVDADNAIAFWGSEDTRTVRLSAYYEVRVVMLEPEPPRTQAGIVLSLGAFVQQLGAPHLACSQNQLQFTLPVVAGGGTQTLESSPARVSTETAGTPAANHRLQLLGTNLSSRSETLILKNNLWRSRPDLLGGPVGEVSVDFGLNAPEGWEIEVFADRVELAIAGSLQFDNAGAADAVAVVPGLYSTQLRVVHDEEVILGQLKQISSRSNETTFIVIPRIIAITANAPSNELTIQIEPTFDLNLGEAAADDRQVLDIQVVVAGQTYERVASGTPPQQGEFSPGTDTLVLQAQFVVTNPGLYPARLMVNGAESQPFWFEVP